MVLVVNIGSSSVKLGLFSPSTLQSATGSSAVWEMKLDWGEVTTTRQQALRDLLARVPDPAKAKVVGHRIVHGGNRYHDPVMIDASVKDAIREFTKFAPIHNPAGLL